MQLYYLELNSRSKCEGNMCCDGIFSEMDSNLFMFVKWGCACACVCVVALFA